LGNFSWKYVFFRKSIKRILRKINSFSGNCKIIGRAIKGLFKKISNSRKENNVSTSTLRNRLRENYGYDYFKKLMKNDNNKKMVQLYENGFSINQIAKN